MKVAFYSPIKPPGHPVPSGDRLMARLLMRALELGGARVAVASEFRAFRREPPVDGMSGLRRHALMETDRIADDWGRHGVPDLFLAYHSYYKAPDLVGPALAARFSIPYVTVETSYSRRRNASGWREMQEPVGAGILAARVNISMTARDRDGLLANFPEARTAMLPPFLDPAPFLAQVPRPEPGHLVTVAMMRPGDKVDSYRILAAALNGIRHRDWSLSVVGDGPARGEVEALFSNFGPGRIRWHGQLDEDGVAGLLSRASLYLWPGCGEAYGLAYLEAQAAGVPVVAMATAGVPAVVVDGETGLLTPDGEIEAYAEAIQALLSQTERRLKLAQSARRFVAGERSLPGASRRLMEILREFAGPEQ